MAMLKTLDFTGVETYKTAPEGKHSVEISKIELVDFTSGDGFRAYFRLISGAGRDAVVRENFPIMQQSMWKIKLLLECVGINVNGKIKLDLEKLVGKKLIIEVEHEEYDGKTYARAKSLFPLSELASEQEDVEEEPEELEEVEEAPKPKAKPKAKSKPEPVEEDDDDDVEEVTASPVDEPEDDDDDEWDDDDDTPF